MDRAIAVRVFSELRQEAGRLTNQETLLGPDFYAWHDRTRTALKDTFGPGSEEEREFLGIRFELDPNLLAKTERALHELIAEAGSVDLSVNQQRCYQQGLAQAAEQLLAVLTDLQDTP